MISNPFFARITFKDGYGSNRDLNNCFATKDARDKWVETSLEKYNSNRDNTITEVIINFGEVSEQYTAAKIWQVTPINGTKAKTSLPVKEHIALEI